MRLVARGFVASALFTVVGAGAACGRVLSDDAPAAAPDAAASDAATSATDGASDRDAGPSPPSGCSVARAPSCPPSGCTQRVLYANPNRRGAPWGIAADDHFVYWLEQPATIDGYNGLAEARVLRASKVPGADTTVATELVVDQKWATVIAVAGGWVYWTVYEIPDGGAPFAKLRRARADCKGGCSSEEVVVPESGVRVSRLVPTAPGVLYGLGEQGHVFRFDVGGPVMQVRGPLTIKPGGAALVATEQHLYLSSAKSPTIDRLSLDGTNIEPDFLAIPPRDGGDQGFTFMWADCTDLWAMRAPQAELVQVSPADGGMKKRATVPLNLYGLAGDATYLYLAGANQGLYALERSPTNETKKVGGTKVFAVAADADGVYWGEHEIALPTAGTITMLVK